MVRSSPRGVLGRALARGTRWRARLHHDRCWLLRGVGLGLSLVRLSGFGRGIASHNKGGADVTNGAMGPSPTGGGVVGLLQARGRPSPADPVVDGGLGFLCLGAGHWPARCTLRWWSRQVRMHDDPRRRSWGWIGHHYVWDRACHFGDSGDGGVLLSVSCGSHLVAIEVSQRLVTSTPRLAPPWVCCLVSASRPACVNVASGPVVARVNQARARLVGHVWPFGPRLRRSKVVAVAAVAWDGTSQPECAAEGGVDSGWRGFFSVRGCPWSY